MHALHASSSRCWSGFGGHIVDDLDLYAEKFDPVMSREGLLRYVDTNAEDTRGVEAYVQRLRAAEALVLVFPVWFDGLPAIMQGYFQRVFLPGVSVRIDESGLFPSLNLRNIKRMAAVCAYGEAGATSPQRGPAAAFRARQRWRADRSERPLRVSRPLRHELSSR